MNYKIKNYGPLLLIFITSIAMTFTGTYMSLFLKTYLLFSNKQIGLYYAISSIANVIISMVLAFASDKSQRLRNYILYIGLISATIGYYLFSIIHSFIALLLVSVTLLAISSCITPQLFALTRETLVNSHIEENKITQIMTMSRSVISGAYVVGPLIATFILDEIYFSRLFVYASIVYFISLILIYAFYKNFNGIENKKKTTSIKINVDYKTIILLFVMFILIQIVHSMISTIFPIFLTEVKGMDNKMIGIISSYSAIAEIPLLFIWSNLVKKISLKNILISGIISGILFIVIIYSIQPISLLCVSYLLNAIFYTITVGLGMSFFQRSIQFNPGIATTLFTNTSSIGKTICGFLLSSIGNNYNSIMIITFFCLIISEVLLISTDSNNF